MSSLKPVWYYTFANFLWNRSISVGWTTSSLGNQLQGIGVRRHHQQKKEWITIVEEIYLIENLTCILRLQKSPCKRKWEK